MFQCSGRIGTLAGVHGGSLDDGAARRDQPVKAFARRHFQMTAGERCGDHLVAAYVARVNAMKKVFAKLAADDD